jgi:hypothetical protein
MSTTIVLASRYDKQAALLASRWDAALLSPVDLSIPGWRYRAPGFDQGSVVAAGREIPNREIRGVLTLLPFVDQRDLEHVHPEDRAYVASEMSAFLLAWLSALRCPVINRPSPECLCGPGWRVEQWLRLALRLGIPVQPIQRDSGAALDTNPLDAGTVVTVVGDRCFCDADPILAANAARLAGAAGVELLEVRFTGPARGDRFVTANVCPDLSAAATADAVMDRFGELVAC